MRMSLDSFLWRVNIECRLDIDFLVPDIYDKVYFVLTLFALAVNHTLNLDNSDINTVTSADYFIVKHILHEV